MNCLRAIGAHDTISFRSTKKEARERRQWLSWATSLLVLLRGRYAGAVLVLCQLDSQQSRERRILASTLSAYSFWEAVFHRRPGRE